MVGLADGLQIAVAGGRQLEPAPVVERRQQQVPVGSMRESRKKGN